MPPSLEALLANLHLVLRGGEQVVHRGDVPVLAYVLGDVGGLGRHV